MKILISDDIYNRVLNSNGAFFEKISGVPKEVIASDCLEPKKAINQAEILLQHTSLMNKKVLEIGSGFGINHIVWSKEYHIDGYGIEPDTLGFESSYSIAKDLVKLNALDETKILNAFGEKIPFDNETFDIVYSTNVLEHVLDPKQVLDEGLRVLKKGGTMQIVFPNYHSFFDGHYALFHPPVLHHKFFPWYVAKIFGRDPEFATTLRTELNYFWSKKNLQLLSEKYDFEILSYGEEVFMDRMKNLNFDAWAGLGIVKKCLAFLKKIKLNVVLGHLLKITGAFTPIILTLKKN